MAKKRLTKDEYAEATGLSAGGAEKLYQDLRNWRRAKTREDLRKGLYLTQSTFAAAGGRPIQAYRRDYQSPAEIQAMQASLLKEISSITEWRRKDAEAYRKALLEAAVRVQGKRSDASVARMRIQGDLVKKAHDELKTQYKVLTHPSGKRGGELYVDDDGNVVVKPLTKGYLEGLDKELGTARSAIETRRQEASSAGISLMHTPGLFVEDPTSGLKGPEVGKELFKRLKSAEKAEKDEELAVFDAAAMGIYGGVYSPDKVNDMLEDDLLLYALDHPDAETRAELGITIGPDGSVDLAGTNDEEDLERLKEHARLNAGRGEEFELYLRLADKLDKDRETDEDGSGSRGGGSYLRTIEGLSPEQYQARLAQIHSVMQSIGAGGGDLEPIMAELLGAGDLSMEQLQGIEEKLKVTVTQPMSQGEGESGRTPTGEGALPPGTSGMATGQRDPNVESPGEQSANKIADVQDPDAALNRMWEMYEGLNNARTSAMDVHLLGQIQKSAPWQQMKQKMGIEDDRKALKAAMMLTRQQKRDANIRDSSKLRKIREETRRSSLLGGLSRLDKPKAKPPRPASAGAMLTGGAEGFPGDE